ncbi:MAG TPA: helix-turn-helix domain-containing protein [Tangfeifania sp.]|nr:helix-turn-helix domain-containing protein [Tangfeifania sp.]
MKTLKYSVVKNEKQYNQYCNLLEEFLNHHDEFLSDEIELLTLLIEKWDEEHNSFGELNPVELLKKLMEENNLRAKDIATILNLSKGTVSKILNYQKGLSKDTIRKLALHFKLNQEAFNRPYKLVNPVNKKFRDASLMNTKKDMENKIAI